MLILLCEEIILLVLSTRKTIMDRLQICATPVSVVLHFIVVQRVAFSVFLVWTSFALHLLDNPDVLNVYTDLITGSSGLQQVYFDGNLTTTNSSLVSVPRLCIHFAQASMKPDPLHSLNLKPFLFKKRNT